MDIELISEKKDGYVIKRTYSCPCGKGYVEEEQDYTPGHRDGFAWMSCAFCDKHYLIDFGSSLTKWKVVPKSKVQNRGEKDMKKLEIWADSFHEGVWCCDNICESLKVFGYTYSSNYINGFIPHYVISKNNVEVLDLVVYGSYKSWNPMPAKIKELISWGKPDFIAYDEMADEILFAVEETAATPTGNQAMQRCERQYGSAHLRIPYWYFVSEYGEHVDGGVRRDNIWPSIAAIKLTLIQKVPCIVLHYSDIDNVEDYNAGNGLGLLFSSLSNMVNNHVLERDIFFEMEPLLAKQYKEMSSFISSQWSNVIDFLPSKSLLLQAGTADVISRFALNKTSTGDISIKDQILVWPLISGVPDDVVDSQQGKALIKHDALAILLERDITRNKCYHLLEEKDRIIDSVFFFDKKAGIYTIKETFRKETPQLRNIVKEAVDRALSAGINALMDCYLEVCTECESYGTMELAEFKEYIADYAIENGKIFGYTQLTMF